MRSSCALERDILFSSMPACMRVHTRLLSPIVKMHARARMSVLARTFISVSAGPARQLHRVLCAQEEAREREEARDREEALARELLSARSEAHL